MSLTASFDYSVMPQDGANLTANWNPVTSRLECGFQMRAWFFNQGEPCEDGEYRQYVSGSFKTDGTIANHLLCSDPLTFLSETIPQEDGCPCDGTAYGHREYSGPLNYYGPLTSDGQAFYGEDTPSIFALQGATVEMNLAFRAQLIDKRNSDAVLAETSWSVTGYYRNGLQQEAQAKVATDMQSEAQAKTRDGENVYAKIWRDSEATDWSGLLVVGHPGGEADPSGQKPQAVDLAIAVWNGSGEGNREIPLTRGKLATVGGSMARTSTLYFSLPRGARPVQLTGHFEGKHFNLLLTPVAR